MYIKTHRIPSWMLKASAINAYCSQCNSQLRFAQNQTFCLFCWERRTLEMVERGARSLIAYKKRLKEASEGITEDDTNGYRIYEDEAIVKEDWKGVMEFKWRIAVLEMTGKRLPMTAYESKGA